MAEASAKYKFDLYQGKGDDGLPPGLTTSVAKYINSLQNTVYIEDGGPFWIKVHGSPPYEIDKFTINFNLRSSNRIWLALVSYHLVNKFYVRNIQSAVISNQFLPND
ncbi:MAG: hypothetical protein ABII79_03830, partial [bacterium]